MRPLPPAVFAGWLRTSKLDVDQSFFWDQLADHLLTHDSERLELSRHLRARINTDYALAGRLAEMVAWVRDSGAI